MRREQYRQTISVLVRAKAIFSYVSDTVLFKDINYYLFIVMQEAIYFGKKIHLYLIIFTTSYFNILNRLYDVYFSFILYLVRHLNEIDSQDTSSNFS